MSDKAHHKFNAIRKTLGMTQYAYAKHLGISPTTASAYARGRNEIPFSVLERAVRLLNAVMPISTEPRPVKHQMDKGNGFTIDRYGRRQYYPKSETLNGKKVSPQLFVNALGRARMSHDEHGRLIVQAVFEPEIEE